VSHCPEIESSELELPHWNVSGRCIQHSMPFAASASAFCVPARLAVEGGAYRHICGRKVGYHTAPLPGGKNYRTASSPVSNIASPNSGNISEDCLTFKTMDSVELAVLLGV
jgi:hypothetical protein